MGLAGRHQCKRDRPAVTLGEQQRDRLPERDEAERRGQRQDVGEIERRQVVGVLAIAIKRHPMITSISGSAARPLFPS